LRPALGVSRPGTTLVVGGDGLIGSAIAARLRGAEAPVIVTTRRPLRAAKDVFHLNLADDPNGWPSLPRAGAAVICAAVARLSDCESDPAARSVNVDGTLALAERLAAQGCHVLFLSSDKVYDGTAPHRGRDETPCPETEYGRHKAAVERALLERWDTCAVLRLAKVLSPDLPLLRQWVSALRIGKCITPFDNMYLAPITVSFVADLAIRLMSQRATGIYQASGDRDVAYNLLALALAGAVGADRELVTPATADPGVAPPAARARHSTLDMSLEARLFAIAQPETRFVCEEIARAAA
jgi:dTDP-4-dehydrorhamnose reductase